MMNTSFPEPENERPGLPGGAPDDYFDLPTEDAELMDAIKSAVQTIHPDEGFAAQLEAELSGVISSTPASRPAAPARAWVVTFAWTGLALVLMIGLGWAIQNLRTGEPAPGSALRGGGAGSPTALLPADETPTPDAATETPPEGLPLPQPTQPPAASSETPGAFVSQYYLSAYVLDQLLVVNAAPPAVSAQYGVYRLVPPVTPSLDSVRALAARLGMDQAGVFQQIIPGQSFVQFIASNGKQRLNFYYTNDASFDYIADYQTFGVQSLNMPPPDQWITAAEAFLSAHGLLDFPYTVAAAENWPGHVRFTRLYEGLPLAVSQAMVVAINPQGEVQQVSYNPPILEKVGDFAIRSAAEAWQIVLEGTAETGLSIGVHSETPYTLQTWMRAYQLGQQVEMFGVPEVLQPADGGQPQVFLNNYLLIGSAAALAQPPSNGAIIQLWGTAEEAAGSTVINVQGWQTTVFQPEVLTGPVTWEGETALIEVNGQRYRLPDLPTDAPGRQPATVYGVRIPQPADGGSPLIDWITLSSGEGGGGGGGGSPIFAALNLSASSQSLQGETTWPASQAVDPTAFPEDMRVQITSISLVYHLPFQVYTPWAETVEPGLEFIQPVWRFSGRTSSGGYVDILVQALIDDYLVK